MDLQDLRAFLAVADELHFGRAAERLHTAQPPLTRTIQRLERDLGVRLFERTSRHVALTAAGEALLAPATEALEAAERVRMVARSAGRGVVGRVRLGYAGASSLALVGAVARAAHERHPGLVLDLSTPQSARGLMELLVDGELDLAVGRWDDLPRQVDATVIARERLVIAVPDTHRLADRASVTMRDLANERFVSLPMGTGALPLRRLVRMAREVGVSYDVVQTAPDSWTLMSLVSAEVGCSITVASVAPMIADPHVRFLHLDHPDARVDLSVAWRTGHLSAAASRVRSLCCTTAVPGLTSPAGPTGSPGTPGAVTDTADAADRPGPGRSDVDAPAEPGEA